MHIGIVGLGLIGGSIAKTIKKVHSQNSYIVAYDAYSPFTESALKEGVIDEIAPSLGEAFNSCTVIFICTPVSSILPTVKALLPYVCRDCILTDIGSTKHDLVNAIQTSIESQGKPLYFVGGHPMAGSEKSGYFASTNYLFENAYYLLTPSTNTPEFILFILQKMVERLGAIPLVMSPKYHDFATSIISHFPHIVASGLVHLVKSSDQKDHLLHTLAAGGFKDITRIASSDPTLWSDICLSNKEQLITAFKTYMALLDTFYEHLKTDNHEGIYTFFNDAKNYRNTFNEGISTPFIKHYTLYVDAEDEPGIIACIATLLSAHGINIKDIGIMNHREFESGVLRIAFASQKDMLFAHQLLAKHNYTLYT